MRDRERFETNLESIWGSIAVPAAIVVFVNSAFVIARYSDSESEYGNAVGDISLSLFAIYLGVLFWQTQRKVGRLSVSIAVTSASLLGLGVSGFIAYVAYSTDKGLLSQGCLYAVSTILFCEVLYLQRIVAGDVEMRGGTSVVS